MLDFGLARQYTNTNGEVRPVSIAFALFSDTVFLLIYILSITTYVCFIYFLWKWPNKQHFSHFCFVHVQFLYLVVMFHVSKVISRDAPIYIYKYNLQ